MVWCFAPHCHVAKIQDDLVILDAERGVYLCLPGLGASSTVTTEGAPAFAGGPASAKLAMAGILLPQAAPAPIRRDLPPPVRANLPPGDLAPKVKDLWSVLAVYAAMIWKFRLRRFGAVLRQAREGGSHRAGRPSSPRALYADVHAFLAWLPWLPFQGECLLRSFMLLTFLRRRGHDAKWVFAVATWPFAAHCWLQAGEVVLNDQAGRLSRYTPILAV